VLRFGAGARSAFIGLFAFLSLVPASEAKAARRVPARFRATAPVRLLPAGDEPLSVRGLHSYFGTLELRSASNGLVVTDRLSLQRYLVGLNEVPSSWPIEALRAQAVAARTYARWTLARPAAGAAAVYGFDICASDQCQVFSGADVAESPHGARWVEAVSDTSGETVLFEGRPILARYHSTSGGVTLANPQAFPGERDLPYLQPVRSEAERGSPLYRWRVEVSLHALQRILEGAGWWGRADGALRGVHTAAGASSYDPDVIFQGRTMRRQPASALRSLLRDWAPRLFPHRYPSHAATPTGRLPETMPSHRVDIATRNGTVVIAGRGWGHGVGMSQWGARGMALAGAGHERILTHYYTDTTVGRLPDPGPIEVGLDWALPSVTVFGSFGVVDAAGRTIVRHAAGTWRFRPDGASSLDLDAPPAFGRRPRVEILRMPPRARAGDTVGIVIELAAPAQLSTATRRVGAKRPGIRSVTRSVTKDAGRRRVAWRAPRKPGRYRVRVRANLGAKQERSAAATVVVARRAHDGGPTRATGGGWGTAAVIVVAVVFIGLVAVGAASFVGTMKR
jgi:SpoIID/LytB domain protein